MPYTVKHDKFLCIQIIIYHVKISYDQEAQNNSN